jgi:MFS family permease
MSNKHDSRIIVAACFIIQAVGVGTFVSYGVFFNSLAGEFGWSRAVISGASSLAFLLSGVFGIVIGRLNDIYGPRNLVRIAAIFLGTGVMLMTQVSEIWQLYVFYGIIFGIGLGAIDVIALTTTARWFSHSRGFMTGLVKVGTGAGQFLIPFLASILIAAYGWRQAYLNIGAVVMVILFAVAQVLKRDPGAGISRERSGPRLKSLYVQEKNLSVKDAIRTVQLWIICGVNVLLVFCLLIILVHIVPHAIDLGLSTTQAAGVLSTIGAVSMAGRFTAGIAIDRIGSKPIMAICLLILITALLWLQVADSLWMLYLFASVYGVAHGAFFTAISPIVAEVFGITSHGAIFGIVVFFGTVGGAIGPIVAGQMFDITGSYTMVFIMITLISVVGLCLILFLKPISSKLQTTER